MRVLVTGGAGFIGRHVVRALLARGHHVCVVDNLCQSSAAGLPRAISLVTQDIRDGALADTCRNFAADVVVHLAAQSAVGRSLEAPLYDAEINVMGTLLVVEAAKAAGARRLVFASSGGTVYGQARVLPTPESAPLAPVSPYGASKAAAEQYVGLANAQGALGTVSLRLGNVFGPGQSAEGEAGVVARFCAAVTQGRAVGLCGDGQQVRDFVWVGDVAEAIVGAAEHGEASGAINVGTGTATAIGPLATLVAEAAGMPLAIDRLPARPAEVRSSCLLSERARQVLGWRARHSVAEGLERTLSYWRQKLPTKRLARAKRDAPPSERTRPAP